MFATHNRISKLFFLKIFVFYIGFLLAIGVGLESLFVIDSGGQRVVVFDHYAGGDYGFYKDWQSKGIQLLIEPIPYFLKGLQGLAEWSQHEERPGPIFVWILDLTNFSVDNVIFFRIFEMVCGAWLVAAWLCKLKEWQTPKFYLALYFLCPLTLWIVLIPGPDVLLGIFTFYIYDIVVSNMYSRKRTAFLFILVIFSMLTKPNALVYCILFFIYCYTYLNREKKDFRIILLLLLMVVTTLFCGLYYFPYFSMYSESSQNLSYWGISEGTYIGYILKWEDNPLTSIFWFFNLVLSKLLYLTGLRPSFSDQAFVLVAIRACTSLILVPGIFGLIKSKNYFNMVFCFIVILPCLTGAAQERYLMPVLPIVFYYGVLAIEKFRMRIVSAMGMREF